MADESGMKRFYNENAARILGEKIRDVHPGFDLTGYVREVKRRVPGKELKDRVLVLTEGLRSRLPQEFPDAVGILLSILGEELRDGQGMFNDGWFLMPVARFVEEYGLAHPEASLDALVEITKRHTAEYAVRPFIEQHYELTMARMPDWATDPSHHVRRMASESTRPRLPWARTLTRFVDDPRPVLAVLELMRSDPSGYVRKSVANNLNDISKDWPELVLATAARWSAESPTPETRWIVKHSLRTLIKKGDQQALAIVGATGGEHIEVRELRLSPRRVRLGGSVAISFRIANTDRRPHSVAVDYVVHHVRKNGSRTPKVFKLATVELAAGETRALTKSHPVKAVTTRTYYPGEHLVDIQVNGRVTASDGFELRI